MRCISIVFHYRNNQQHNRLCCRVLLVLAASFNTIYQSTLFDPGTEFWRTCFTPTSVSGNDCLSASGGANFTLLDGQTAGSFTWSTAESFRSCSWVIREIGCSAGVLVVFLVSLYVKRDPEIFHPSRLQVAPPQPGL